MQAVRGTVHAPPSTVAPTVPDLALPSSRSYGAPILLLPSVDEALALAVLGRGDSGWLSCWLCGTSGKRHQTRPVQQPTKIFPAILIVRESSSPVVGNCGNNKSTACEGLDLLLLLLCRMHLFQVPAAQTSIHTIPYIYTYTYRTVCPCYFDYQPSRQYEEYPLCVGREPRSETHPLTNRSSSW